MNDKLRKDGKRRLRPYRLFSPLMGEKICRLAEKGMYKKHIAARCGISVSTLGQWLDPRRDDEGLIKFRENFAAAEAAHVERLVQNIEEAADSDPKYWKGSAWVLERRYPLDYGERKHISHTAPQAGMTAEAFAKLSPEQQDQYDKLLQGMEELLLLTDGEDDDL